jgi:serine/threonine-protein kinase HipA
MHPSKIASPLLNVHLGAIHVGTLRLTTTERTYFTFTEAYRNSYPRHVLGQYFIDHLDGPHYSRMRVPPFFSNLLPEGPLRDLIATKLEVSPEREFFLIALLGDDLPGAVTVTPHPESRIDWELAGLPVARSRKEILDDEQLRFSLAGVQLKFSMLRKGRGMTLPAQGKGGDWIVKLPDNRYKHVPENEFSMMTWARAAGIDVPEIALIKAKSINGLPKDIELQEEHAFAIRRFDRPAPNRKVHIEHMLQVFNLHSSHKNKYKTQSYETVANIFKTIGGYDSFHEFIRRLVFCIACGNADAHLKNWSLIYPDGVNGNIAPAYDYVFTLPYIKNDSLALSLNGERAFESVSLKSFDRLARKLGADSGEVQKFVRSTVNATLQAWRDIHTKVPFPDIFKQSLEDHWKKVPLLRTR